MRGRIPATLFFLFQVEKVKVRPTGFAPPAEFIFFVSTKKMEPKESDPNAPACPWQVPSAPQKFDALAKLACGSNIPRLIAKYLLRSSGGKGGGDGQRIKQTREV